MNLAAGATQPPRLAIELEIAGDELRGDALRLGAAQERSHRRHQLRNRERLHHIIVGTDGEAAHALGLLASRRQHDDGKRAGRIPRT